MEQRDSDRLASQVIEKFFRAEKKGMTIRYLEKREEFCVQKSHMGGDRSLIGRGIASFVTGGEPKSTGSLLIWWWEDKKFPSGLFSQ